MSYASIVVIGALCLLFSATRKYAILSVAVLLIFQPALTMGILTVAGIAFLLYYWRTTHE
jgi:hypothetical protein